MRPPWVTTATLSCGLADDLGRLVGPPQVAGVEGLDGKVVAQPLAEGRRLLPAHVVQGRVVIVGVPVQAIVTELGVTEKMDQHARIIADRRRTGKYASSGVGWFHSKGPSRPFRGGHDGHLGCADRERQRHWH
jgi:hypothetical protein